MNSETSEWTLIDRCQRGDASAFEPLVRGHEARALAMAHGLLGDLDDAQDAVQDAFVRAFRSLGSIAAGSEFGPWFRSILRNLCLDRLRSHNRRRRTSWHQPTVDRAASVDAVGSSRIESDELAGRVHDALGRLSPEHREVLVLKELEGMSYAAIAAATGVSAGTVASRLHHARSALRTVIAGAPATTDGRDA